MQYNNNHHGAMYGGYTHAQPQYVNQFAHNPYIGYAPHNNLHAAYNFTLNWWGNYKWRYKDYSTLFDFVYNLIYIYF